MIKSELIGRIASQNPHLYQRDIENIVNAIFDEIVKALGRGEGKFDMYVEDECAAYVRYCFKDPMDAAIFRSRFESKSEPFTVRRPPAHCAGPPLRDASLAKTSQIDPPLTQCTAPCSASFCDRDSAPANACRGHRSRACIQLMAQHMWMHCEWKLRSSPCALNRSQEPSCNDRSASLCGEHVRALALQWAQRS
jgi:hypothetical protein